MAACVWTTHIIQRFGIETRKTGGASAVLSPFRSVHQECSGMCSGFRAFAKPTLIVALLGTSH